MSQEEKRQTILRIREENKRIYSLIVQGTAKHEPVEVEGIDRQKHTFEVFALSDGDLAELLSSTGVELKDIGKREKLAENTKFLVKGAGLATGVPDVGKALTQLDSLKLIMKAFEISGYTGAPKMDSTISSPQPAPAPPN
jgi:hypothetical protein